jgi:hypothetical protein
MCDMTVVSPDNAAAERRVEEAGFRRRFKSEARPPAADRMTSFTALTRWAEDRLYRDTSCGNRSLADRLPCNGFYRYIESFIMHRYVNGRDWPLDGASASRRPIQHTTAEVAIRYADSVMSLSK